MAHTHCISYPPWLVLLWPLPTVAHTTVLTVVLLVPAWTGHVVGELIPTTSHPFCWSELISCLFVCPSVNLSVCPSVCLSICLFCAYWSRGWSWV